MLTGEAMPV